MSNAIVKCANCGKDVHLNFSHNCDTIRTDSSQTLKYPDNFDNWPKTWQSCFEDGVAAAKAAMPQPPSREAIYDVLLKSTTHLNVESERTMWEIDPDKAVDAIMALLWKV